MKINAMLLTLAAGAALCACNDISEDDRFIQLPAVEAKRVVLLEEFTGQKCINCPAAHDIIEKTIEQYPDNFIAVSIHGGPLAVHEDKETYGLANDDGEAYYQAYGSPAPPAGVVNRVTSPLTSALWSSNIADEIGRASNLDITLAATLNSDQTAVELETTLDPHDNITGNMVVWVVEDGIMATQHFPGGVTNRRYVHNHVLRQAANGLDGEPVNLTIREPQTLKNVINLKEKWVPANLSLVVFVYNKSGVLQAARIKIAPAEEG